MIAAAAVLRVCAVRVRCPCGCCRRRPARAATRCFFGAARCITLLHNATRSRMLACLHKQMQSPGEFHIQCDYYSLQRAATRMHSRYDMTPKRSAWMPMPARAGRRCTVPCAVCAATAPASFRFEVRKS